MEWTNQKKIRPGRRSPGHQVDGYLAGAVDQTDDGFNATYESSWSQSFFELLSPPGLFFAQQSLLTCCSSPQEAQAQRLIRDWVQLICCITSCISWVHSIRKGCSSSLWSAGCYCVCTWVVQEIVTASGHASNTLVSSFIFPILLLKVGLRECFPTCVLVSVTVVFQVVQFSHAYTQTNTVLSHKRTSHLPERWISWVTVWGAVRELRVLIRSDPMYHQLPPTSVE